VQNYDLKLGLGLVVNNKYTSAVMERGFSRMQAARMIADLKKINYKKIRGNQRSKIRVIRVPFYPTYETKNSAEPPPCAIQNIVIL